MVPKPSSAPKRPVVLRRADPFWVAIALLAIAKGAAGLAPHPVALAYYQASLATFVAILIALLFGSRFVSMFERLGAGRRVWWVLLASIVVGLGAALWPIATGRSYPQAFGLTVAAWVVGISALFTAAFDKTLNPVYEDESEPDP